ncbi:hypothetical protein [Microcoleus sp. Pol11C3]|uniref:hypothetical protein n=1 Tax=Microcoleus sp. Pol11C3 TaxID=3055390 RepID=UPI002FD00241
MQRNKPPTKWQIYEIILKISYYFVLGKYNHLRVFRLAGNLYREQVLTGSRFWIMEIKLSLGLWKVLSWNIRGCGCASMMLIAI